MAVVFGCYILLPLVVFVVSDVLSLPLFFVVVVTVVVWLLLLSSSSSLVGVQDNLVCTVPISAPCPDAQELFLKFCTVHEKPN